MDAGIYNGLALMRDLETSSLWHHITGECIDGTLAGASLEDEHPLHYLTAAETLKRFPQAVFPVKVELKWWQRLLANIFRRTMWTDTNGMIPPIFRPFMPKRDERLPELEVGLGVAHKGEARFYRLSTLNDYGSAVIDTLAGEQMVVFIDPYSSAPHAICTSADTCYWEDKTLMLDNNTHIEHGLLKADDGSVYELTYPHQVFTRWYGFSFTYPHCGIYERVPAKRAVSSVS